MKVCAPVPAQRALNLATVAALEAAGSNLSPRTAEEPA
jgi:hypothetical protein